MSRDSSLGWNSGGFMPAVGMLAGGLAHSPKLLSAGGNHKTLVGNLAWAASPTKAQFCQADSNPPHPGDPGIDSFPEFCPHFVIGHCILVAGLPNSDSSIIFVPRSRS